MRCPKCQAENLADSAFCQECGARLESGCPSCGAENPPTSRFCRKCGHAFGGGATQVGVESVASSGPTTFAQGRYQVQRFLGESATKRVFLARDTQGGREVAVAVIKTDGLGETGVGRVRREAQAMRRLSTHPHIVTVHDVIEEGGAPCVISQYAAGGDLAARLKAADGHRLPIPDAIRIASQICDALEYAHQRGVVHRELKPAIVWLTSSGDVVVGDFGLALAFDRAQLTQPGAMLNAALYMAPEGALGRAADARADLYALGAILYEMVAGHPPFVGQDAVAVLSQQVNAAPVAPSWYNSEVSEGLERLILELLAKSPEQRPAIANVRARLGELARTVRTATPIVHGEADVLEALIEGTFVGRHDEISHLHAAVESALAGRGSVILLGGESGIGKTRVAEEVATYARLRRATVLEVRLPEGSAASPFWPWVQILRAYVAERSPAALASEMGAAAPILTALVPDIGARLPASIAPAALTAIEQERYRLFRAVGTFATNAAQQQPALFLFDNLHWLDEPSLMLLKYLAKELRDVGVLILGTYRDVELPRSDPRADIVSELRRDPAFERLTLAGMSAHEVHALLAAMSGGAEFPESLAQAIHRESGGNPFYVGEILRLLVENGTIRRRDGHWSSTAAFVQDLGFSDASDAVEQRLARLSDPCRTALDAAAVIGGVFETEILSAVVETSPEALRETLREGVQRRIIRPLGASQYHFAHFLLRHALYEKLPANRKMQLHRKVGKRIEQMADQSRGSRLWALVQHFVEAAPAGESEKAFEYTVRAAEHSNAWLAPEEALHHYQGALDALEMQDAPDQRRRGEILVTLAETAWRAGEPRRARDSAQRAADIARRLPDPELEARAALASAPRLSGFATAGPDDALIARLDAALASLGPAETPLRARLLARLAEELQFSDPDDRRQRLAREAVAIARQSEDPETRAFVMRSAHWALWSPDTLDERVGLASELEQRVPVVDASVIDAHPLRAWNLLEAGDVSGAREELAFCSRSVNEAPHPYLQWVVGATSTLLALVEGRFSQIEPLAHQTLEAAPPAHSRSAALVFGLQMATLHRLQGRAQEERKLLQGALETYPALAPDLNALLAAHHSLLGDQAQARRHFEPAVASLSGHLRNSTWLGYVAALAQASADMNDHPRAAELYDLLAPFSTRIAIAGPLLHLGPVSYHLARLAAALGRPDEAVRHFEQVLELTTREGMRPAAALAQHAYANFIVERGAAAEQARAFELLEAALSTAEAVGMRTLASVARTLKQTLRPEAEPAAAATVMEATAMAGTMMDPIAAGGTAVTQVTAVGRATVAPSAPPGRVTIEAGTTIERTYELTEQIGKGGMGAVWAARHQRLRGKRVAIKFLLDAANIGAESYARFRHEAEIASRLGHPNIVEVLDFNQLPDGTPYIVMEFLQGESLGARFRRGAMPLESVVQIVRQIGSALSAAHQLGIVHRDLKPENIFLTPTEIGTVKIDHVRVLDFGISKVRDSDTVHTQVDVLIGTPRYMSPEQALGRNDQIDARTDIFAFGAIVYEMLAQRPAFTGDSLPQMLYRVVHEPPASLAEIVPAVPAKFVAAVERALEKDPSKRFAEVAQFVDMLG